MIELERHLEVLLLNNDCVIVPELGGFMAHHIDARYDKEEHVFLPPLRTLGFNPQLKINDSLLAQSYVETYDISYPEALRRIEEEVNELRQHLQNDGSYELNDFGILSLNEDCNYVFTPCESGILTPDLYGLNSFEMTTLSQSEDKVVNTYDIEQKSPIEEEMESLSEDEEEEDSDDDFVQIKYSWLRNTVAVAAVLLAIVLLALPSGKTELMTRTISNLNNTILFGMMSKDTNTSKIDFKRCDIHHSSTKTDTIQKSDTPIIQQQTKPGSARQGYCIVLASQVSMKNAKTFIEYLEKKGYNNVEIYIHNNITRVIYGNYPTQMDAYNDLRGFHRHPELNQAWIYKFNETTP
ncbi:MAG: SPOR domain-containing protein [Prevotella sp.]|nr:SPOR domain-containing protein [Prevotella sp.]